MNKPISQLLRTFKLYVAVLALTLVSGSAFSQDPAADFAGSIVYTKGGVVAIDVNGDSRSLSRRANIYIGDTVYTAEASSVQLSMSDSAQIVLGESTVFEIADYTYEDADSDSVILNLVEGGFRTVTGRVAKSNYRTEVNGFSNIGIRGTEYEAQIVQSDRLIVGLYDGGVTLSNFGGDLDLGLGADFDYAEVSSMFAAPVGLDVIPTGLNELPLAVAVQLPEEEEEDAAAIAGTVDTIAPTDNLIAAINTDLAQPGQGAAQAVDSIDAVVAIDANAVPTAPGAADAAATTSVDGTASADTARASSFSTPRRLARNSDRGVLDGLTQDVSTLAAEVDSAVGATTDTVASVLDAGTDAASNLRTLTDVEIPLQDISLLETVSETIQELPVDDAAALINSVGSVSTAALVDNTASTAGNLIETVVETVETAAPVVVDTANNLVDNTVTDTVANVAGTTGDAGDSLLDTVVEVVVDTTGTATDTVETTAGTVAGTTETVTETVADTTETVTETVAGTTETVTETVADTTETATETVADTTETATETVADTTETATETVADTTETATETVADTTETATETVATVEETVEETVEDTVGGILGGESEEEDSSGGLLGGGSLFVMKQAPTAKKQASSQDWGAWNAPVPEHIAQSMTISAGDYSVDVTPTEVANLTGSYQYSNVTGFEGQGTAGAVTSVDAGFDVDFNTGVIANGLLAVGVGDSQDWALGFDGMVDQGIVDLNALGGTVTDLTSGLNAISPIDGDLSGAFTGVNGEAFVGGFELLDQQNVQNTVDGIYTIER